MEAHVEVEFELLSPRLRLRRLRASDAATICAYRSLPEVARFQSWEAYTLEDAGKLISAQECVVPNTPDTWLQLLLTTLDDGTTIGDCGIHFIAHDGHQVELGITLSPLYQGCGFATEAIACVLGYVFGSLGKHRARANTDAENLASARLFRRLGFRQEAHFVDNVWFKGAWGSEFEFALLKREWKETGLSPSTAPRALDY